MAYENRRRRGRHHLLRQREHGMLRRGVRAGALAAHARVDRGARAADGRGPQQRRRLRGRGGGARARGSHHRPGRGDNRTCVLLSPRVAVKRFLGARRDAAVKVAAGRYVQFLHSLRDENAPRQQRHAGCWRTRNVPPVVSDQVQLGLEKYWGEAWYASAEAYYRTYDGVTDFNVADNPNDPGDDLLTGEGDSYGLDLLVRRSTGRLTGWTTISLLRAERTFPDPLAAGIEGVPQTVTFSPIYDRRVDVDVVRAVPAAGGAGGGRAVELRQRHAVHASRGADRGIRDGHRQRRIPPAAPLRRRPGRARVRGPGRPQPRALPRVPPPGPDRCAARTCAAGARSPRTCRC